MQLVLLTSGSFSNCKGNRPRRSTKVSNSKLSKWVPGLYLIAEVAFTLKNRASVNIYDFGANSTEFQVNNDVTYFVW